MDAQSAKDIRMNPTQRSFNVNENYKKSYKRHLVQISLLPLEIAKLSNLFIRSVLVLIRAILVRIYTCFVYIVKEAKAIMTVKNGQKFNHNLFRAKYQKFKFVRYGNTTCLYSVKMTKKGVFK